MDRIVNIKENFEYQKKNIRDVYNKYFEYNKLEEAQMEVAVTAIDKRKDIYITVLIDNFDNIMQILFNLSDECMENYLNKDNEYLGTFKEILEDAREIEIEKSYGLPVIEVSNSKLKIKCMHPYMLKTCKMVFIKNNKMDKEVLKNSCIIFALRDLTLFEKSVLKEKLHIKYKVESLEELKEQIIKLKPFYNEKNKLSILKNSPERDEIIDTSIIEKNYKATLSIDIINVIIEKKYFQESVDNILKKIYQYIAIYYNKEIDKIVSLYLNKDFFKNFAVVNSLLIEKEVFFKNISEFLIEKVKRELKDIKKENSTSDIYVKLINSSIREIDTIICESIENLNKIINQLY